MVKTTGRVFFLTGLLSLLLPFFFASPAFADWAGDDPSGQGVMPAYNDDLPSNAECTTLGYDYGFKIEGADNGTYPFTDAYGDLQPPGTPDDPTNSVTVANSDGKTFEWSATLGLDAVVVKGGPGANVYAYDPEVLNDTNLHAPLSGSGPGEPGTIRDISHITFCFDYEPAAVGSITIAKASNSTIVDETFPFQSNTDPATFDLEVGQSLTFADLRPPGPYTFAETVPEGFELTNIVCEGAVESTIIIGDVDGFEPGDMAVIISLVAGEDIVCTFTNDPIEPPPTGVGFSPTFLLGGLAIVGVALLAIGGLVRVRGARSS
jgi:hypothetical protein